MVLHRIYPLHLKYYQFILKSLSGIMSIRPLSASLQEKAEKELNEVPSRIQDDLEHIRKWIEQQPHLNARTDDRWLLVFLRGCKFRLQLTKEKMDLYYTMKYLLPIYSTNRDPFSPEIQEFYRRGILVPLPKTVGPAGPRAFIVRTKYVDPELMPPEVAGKAVGMILDTLLNEDDNFLIAGQQVLIDLKDVPYSYVKLITPTLLKAWLIFIQKAYPVRPKSVNFINVPPIVEPLLHLIKQLAAKKIRNRVLVCNSNNIDAIYETYPLSILPTEYGGEAGPISDMIAQIKTEVESYRDWFIEDEQYRSDETKRPLKPITFSDMFGVEGSFRKLDID